jgi:hypothetical protein
LGSAIGLLGSGGLSAFFPARYGPLIWTLSSSSIFTTLGCEWLYAIHEEYGYLALRNIYFQILSLLLLLTYVKDESDLLLYAWSTVASKVTALLKQLLAAMIVVTVPRLACLYGQKVGLPLAQREKAGQRFAGLSLCLLGLPSCFGKGPRAWSYGLLGSPLGYPRLLCDFISAWQPGLAGI